MYIYIYVLMYYTLLDIAPIQRMGNRDVGNETVFLFVRTCCSQKTQAAAEGPGCGLWWGARGRVGVVDCGDWGDRFLVG